MSSHTIDYDALAAQHGGTVQVDYDALAAQHGGTAVDASTAAPDTRNGVQKFVDNLTTVTPEQEKGHSWLANKAQEFGAGAIQGVTAPIVHPLDTLSGIGTMIAHPINSAVAMAKSAVANPAQFAGNVVGGAVLGEAAGASAQVANKAASPVLSRVLLNGKTPEAAYESALKIPPSVDAATRTAAVKTGLDFELPVSKGGAAKLSDLVDKMNKTREAVINSDPTRPISTVRAINNLDKTRARFANQVTPQPDMAEIDAVQNNFLSNPKIQPPVGPSPGSLSAVDAQAMKSGTYRVLGNKAYGELKGASIEAQKDLARGIKDEIAEQFPELKGVNASESRLLDLQPLLERAVNRIGNHQAFGIGTPMMAAGTEAVTGSSKLAAAVAVYKAVFDNPYVKSRLAIAVSKGGKIPMAAAMARVNAYAASLGQYDQQPRTASSEDMPASPPTQ